MPLLASFGSNSTKSFSINPSGGSIWTSFILSWAASTSGRAYPGTQSDYAATATIPVSSNYIFSNGYHYFDIGTGTYNVDIRGAEGSGTQHGYGARILATLVVNQPTRLVALIGNPGIGNYSGGGMTAIALRNTTSDVYTSATPLLVAGGGAGGYSSFHSQLDAGGTTWSSTSRRTYNSDCGSYGGGVYDAGAGFDNSFHQVSVYSCTLNASVAAQGFRNGGRGGIQTACGSGPSQQGGFGGGGGSCPAGGGGYYGGTAGGNSPAATGGGGGTSYRLTSGSIATITSWSDNGTNGSSRTANPGTAGGYLSITAV